MNEKPTYSKKEISRILSRAAEIQTRYDQNDDRDGLTEEELLHVAEEAGISPKALRQAILSVYEDPGANAYFDWITGSSHIQETLYTEGEISEESWEYVIREIRKITGSIGSTNKVGKTYEWEQSQKDIGYKYLSVGPEQDLTRIQFVSSWKGLKFIINFFSFLILFMGTAISLDGSPYNEFMGLFIATLGGIAGLAGGRFFLKYFFEKKKNEAKRLVQSVAKRLSLSGESSITIEEEDVYRTEKPSSSSSSQVRN